MQTLLPHEQHQDFLNLELAWTEAFPGSSFALLTLRQDLIHADWLRRRAAAFFQQLQLDLHSTGLPMPYWNRPTQRQFQFLEKHAARTQQEFRKAFQLIHSFKSAPAKPESPPEPPKPVINYRSVFQQFVEVYVVDGKTVTNAEYDAAFLLRPDVFKLVCGLARQFHFRDGIVPPEYAYVLEHNGVYYGPTKQLMITYREEEVPKICARELASNSPHLLDGERWSYQRSYYESQEKPL